MELKTRQMQKLNETIGQVEKLSTPHDERRVTGEEER